MTVTRSDQHQIVQQRWKEHGWGAEAQMAAYSVLAHTPRLVFQHVDRTLTSIGLTGSRFAVLFTLDCTTSRALTIGQLSRRIAAHPTSVTKLVDHLASAGLVHKSVPEHDRRAVLVELTAKGTEMLERAGRMLAEAQFGLGALDPDGLAQLTTALQIVRRDLMEDA